MHLGIKDVRARARRFNDDIKRARRTWPGLSQKPWYSIPLLCLCHELPCYA
jgi:hypothetical protein